MAYIGYVYILLCSNGKYYTGSTTDLQKRLVEHQEGRGAALIASDFNSLKRLSECESESHINSIYSHDVNEVSKSIREKQLSDQLLIIQSLVKN